MGLVGAHVRSLAGSRTAVFLAKTGSLRPLILKEPAGSSNLNPQLARVLSAGSKASPYLDPAGHRLYCFRR